MITKKRVIVFGIIYLAIIIAIFVWRSNLKNVEYTSLVFETMSTELVVSYPSSSPISSNEVSKIVTETLQEINDCCNVYNPNSELSRLNQSASSEPFQCSDMLYDIFKHSKQAYDFTKGSFDVTSGPLMKLWGFYQKERETLPSEAELKQAQDLVGLDKVEFDDEQQTIYFTVPEMRIDLGGIAKGYAADLIIDRIDTIGAVVNLGGNLRFDHRLPKGWSGYPVSLRNPLKRGETFCSFELPYGAVSTSGNYERYRTIDGVQYTHIMNPVTATPVSGVLAVSVIADTATMADWLSTGIFIGGVEMGRYLASRVNIEVYIVLPADNESGMEVKHFGKYK